MKIVSLSRSRNKIYDLAYDIIINDKATVYPNNIIDWIIAHNFYISGKKVRPYSKLEIRHLSGKDLASLGAKLDLDVVTIDSVINVLTYLDKIGQIKQGFNFGLPPELNIKIASHIDFDTLISYLKDDESVREIIYKAIPLIVANYYSDKERGLEKKEDEDLRSFILKLNQSGHLNSSKREFKLMKKLIDESIKYRPIINSHENEEFDLYGVLVANNNFLSPYADPNLMQKYLELQPNYHWDKINFIVSLGSNKLHGVDILQYYVDILDAAIGAKSMNILKYFVKTWGKERFDWINDKIYKIEAKPYIDELDVLVEEAKHIII